MSRPSPAFQFYPDNFVSGAPAFMKPLETHVYVWLLCLEWTQGGFAYDERNLASWCRISQALFRQAWPKVSESFTERGGRFYNPRLDRERDKQREYSERMAENGKKGGRRKADVKPELSRGLAPAKPALSRSKASSTKPALSTPIPIPTPVTTTTTACASAGADEPESRDTVPAWPARLSAVWGAQVGEIQPGRIGKALKAAVDQHGADRVERAMRAYIAVQKSNGKPCRISWFADESQVWIERTSTPLDVVDGEMSPTLELLTRPAAKGAA